MITNYIKMREILKSVLEMTIFVAGVFWHLKFFSGKISKIPGCKNCVCYFYNKLFLWGGVRWCEGNSMRFWEGWNIVFLSHVFFNFLKNMVFEKYLLR